MSDPNITRLVVGEKFTLTLGVPVGQRLKETDVSNLLRWRKGRWETSVSLIDRIKKAASTEKHTNVLTVPVTKAAFEKATLSKHAVTALSSPKVMWGAVTVGAFVVLTGVFMLGNRYLRSGAEDLPIAPITSSRQEQIQEAVRTIDTPFVSPAPDAAVEPANGVAREDGVVPPPKVPTISPAGVVNNPDVSTTKAESKRKDQERGEKDKSKATDKDTKSGAATPPPPPPAVILDAEATHQAKAQPAAAPAKKEPVVAPAAPPKLKLGTGLVAVTPDGKTALFTNSNTRLPEKFGVGDKLPSGEVIKNIDKNGKVFTDAKEYRLE